MPVAAVVEDKILCMHGGLSPDLERMGQILDIARPTDVPDEGIVCDLLWADPDPCISGWGRNARGVSFMGTSILGNYARVNQWNFKFDNLRIDPDSASFCEA